MATIAEMPPAAETAAPKSAAKSTAKSAAKKKPTAKKSTKKTASKTPATKPAVAATPGGGAAMAVDEGQAGAAGEMGAQNPGEMDGMMMDAEDGEVDFVSIDELQSMGINAGDIKKMRDAGICTAGRVTMVTRKDLTSIRGISDVKADKILEAAKKLTHNGFVTGVEVAQKRKHVIHITTGSKDMDAIMAGGIETKSITEAIGEFRCGKTQLAHTLCVTSQLPTSMGGGNGKVCFIDTEGTFRPEVITQIAERMQLDPQLVLENILVARAHNTDRQLELLAEVAGLMFQDQYRLLIVDSLTALFRSDFSGRGELAERQQKLMKFLVGVQRLADEYNVAVFVTNQVVSDPGAGMTFVSDPKKAVGGHVVAHACTTRLWLRKGRGEQRIVKLYDSPMCPEAEAMFQLTAGGVSDVKD